MWTTRRPAERRPRRLPALVAATLAAAAVAAAAHAALPLPRDPAGGGSEPTAAQAVVYGHDVRIRSAVVWYDGFGDVSILLSPDPTTCASIAARRTGTYVVAWVHSTGPVIQAGQPVDGSGPLRLVVGFSARGGAETADVDDRVELRVTRIDTRPGAVWHGALQVPARMVDGSRFAFTGTFAARWCGRR
jgi:hypothetical protein